jgi:hypothetical protein
MPAGDASVHAAVTLHGGRGCTDIAALSHGTSVMCSVVPVAIAPRCWQSGYSA